MSKFVKVLGLASVFLASNAPAQGLRIVYDVQDFRVQANAVEKEQAIRWRSEMTICSGQQLTTVRSMDIAFNQRLGEQVQIPSLTAYGAYFEGMVTRGPGGEISRFTIFPSASEPMAHRRIVTANLLDHELVLATLGLCDFQNLYSFRVDFFNAHRYKLTNSEPNSLRINRGELKYPCAIDVELDPQDRGIRLLRMTEGQSVTMEISVKGYRKEQNQFFPNRVVVCMFPRERNSHKFPIRKAVLTLKSIENAGEPDWPVPAGTTTYDYRMGEPNKTYRELPRNFMPRSYFWPDRLISIAELHNMPELRREGEGTDFVPIGGLIFSATGLIILTGFGVASVCRRCRDLDKLDFLLTSRGKFLDD